PDPRAEESLVRVDVAHTCDPALVEEEVAYRGGRAACKCPERFGRECVAQRLEPELRVAPVPAFRIPEIEAAEAPDVVVQDGAAIVQLEAHGHVSHLRRARRIRRDDTAGHPEIDHETELVLEHEHDVLAAPRHVLDASA